MFSPKSKEKYPGVLYIWRANANHRLLFQTLFYRGKIIILMYLGCNGKGYEFNVSCFIVVLPPGTFENCPLRKWISQIHSKWFNCEKKIPRNYQVFARSTAKNSVLKVRNDALATQENVDRFPNVLKEKQ